MHVDAPSRNEIIVLPDADVSDPDVHDSSEDEVFLGISGVSDESDEDSVLDDIPAQTSTSVKKNAYPKHTKTSWKPLSEPEQTSKIPTFNGPSNSFEDSQESPIKYFAHHWTYAMSDLVVEQSNLFASQNGVVLNTKRVEINKLLGIMVKMGIVGLPRLNLYWSRDFRMASISETMPRDRFLKLVKYMHFSNNNNIVTNRDNADYNRLAKVQPQLDMFRKQCLELNPDQVQNIDEQMIPFKGKHSLKQYVKNKPKKWGFKVFSRNSADGYMHDFYI